MEWSIASAQRASVHRTTEGSAARRLENKNGEVDTERGGGGAITFKKGWLERTQGPGYMLCKMTAIPHDTTSMLNVGEHPQTL